MAAVVAVAGTAAGGNPVADNSKSFVNDADWCFSRSIQLEGEGAASHASDVN